MTNIRACLAQATIERLDAELLLSFVLEKPRSYLFAWPEKVLSDEQYQHFLTLLTQAQEGVPTAYLLGEKEFWSLDLYVNQHTLIPRPETEQMVDAVLARYDANTQLTVLDAGTGSGAIALALKKERPYWQVFASDYSFEALAIAEKNAQKHHLAVHFMQADWLSALAENSLDLLLSNPPYIAENDVHLPALRYEPISALVAENQGMSDIVTLCQQAEKVLKSQGMLYVEHGYQQQESVQQAFAEQGFVHIHTLVDYAGLPRFTCAEKP